VATTPTIRNHVGGDADVKSIGATQLTEQWLQPITDHLGIKAAAAEWDDPSALAETSAWE